MMQATEPHAQKGGVAGSDQPPQDSAFLRTQAEAEGRRSLLRTLLVCDLVESTALVERLGDQKAANLLRKHDRLARTLVERHGGREIDKTDGFLLLFERPIEAIGFALDYQRSLKQLSSTENVPLSARVGIHMGDVVMWENDTADIARGAKLFEVEGLVKPVAARLSALAQPQQILMSGVVATIARRAHGELGDDTVVRWQSHGRYSLKGIPTPLEVVEVGGSGVAPFRAPSSHGDARKATPWWRRWWVLIIVGTLLAVPAALMWRNAHNEPMPAFSARDWVVVGDLQNQTGDTSFDAAVDTAFRIGLQQSHYVNVISSLQVRQTLRRMERPEGISVDRAIGSEVSLRENAKALILPSVVNYAGGVRVNAELIDPATERTVTSVSATASEEDEVISAVDSVVRQLRGKLGESLAQIQSSSIPLAYATTSNLEALRAYSLSETARGRGDIQLSLNLLHHALKLDPNFAMAYATVAADYVSLDQHGRAEKAIDQALKHTDRLSYIESALLQAQKTTIEGTAVQRVEAWKVVADLYPDNPIGAQNAGLALAGYLNDCQQALPYLTRAAELPQPMRAASLYTAATCKLSTGKRADAIKDFKAAADAGFGGPFLGLADAYIAARQYDKAVAYLNTVPVNDTTLTNLTLRRALLAGDKGNFGAARSTLQQGLLALKPALMTSEGQRLKLDQVGVSWALDDDAAALSQTRSELSWLLQLDKDAQSHIGIDYPTLVASYSRWAARLGDSALAQRGLVIVRKAGIQGYPVRAQLVAVTEAELALARGQPQDAVRIAESEDTHPLWELLEVLARAKAAAGSADAALALNRALAARDLAFGELYENNLGLCTRIVQWRRMRNEADRGAVAPAEASASPKRN